MCHVGRTLNFPPHMRTQFDITEQKRSAAKCAVISFENCVWSLQQQQHTFGTCELSWAMHVGKWNWIWVKKKISSFRRNSHRFARDVRSGMNLFDIKISSTMMDFSTICSLHVGRRSSLTCQFSACMAGYANTHASFAFRWYENWKISSRWASLKLNQKKKFSSYSSLYWRFFRMFSQFVWCNESVECTRRSLRWPSLWQHANIGALKRLHKPSEWLGWRRKKDSSRVRCQLARFLHTLNVHHSIMMDTNVFYVSTRLVHSPSGVLKLHAGAPASLKEAQQRRRRCWKMGLMEISSQP